MKVAAAECPQSSLSLVRQNDGQRYFRLIEFCRKIYPGDVNVTAIKVNKLNEVAIFHHMRRFPYFMVTVKGCPTFIVAGTVITGTCFFAVSAGPVAAVFT